jgi:hypothetical protein
MCKFIRPSPAQQRASPSVTKTRAGRRSERACVAGRQRRTSGGRSDCRQELPRVCRQLVAGPYRSRQHPIPQLRGSRTAEITVQDAHLGAGRWLPLPQLGAPRGRRGLQLRPHDEVRSAPSIPSVNCHPALDLIQPLRFSSMHYYVFCSIYRSYERNFSVNVYSFPLLEQAINNYENGTVDPVDNRL